MSKYYVLGRRSAAARMQPAVSPCWPCCDNESAKRWIGAPAKTLSRDSALTLTLASLPRWRSRGACSTLLADASIPPSLSGHRLLLSHGHGHAVCAGTKHVRGPERGGRRPVSILQRVASVATLSERLAYLARSICEQKARGLCAAPSLPGPVLRLARHGLARWLDTDRQHEPVHRS